MMIFLSLYLASALVFFMAALSLLRGLSGFEQNTKLPVTLLLVTLTTIPGLTTAFFTHSEQLPGLTAGSILGSSIIAVSVILGISAIISPQTFKQVSRFFGIIAAITSTLVFFICFADRRISQYEGILLLVIYLLYIGLSIFSFSKPSQPGLTDINGSNKEKSHNRELIWVLIGLALMFVASKLLVLSALKSGISPTLSGITYIALANGIPLLTVVISYASRKKENIVVWMIIVYFTTNILGIPGILALFSSFSALAVSNIDLGLLVGATLLLTPFFRRKYVLKKEDGFFLITLFGVYVYYLWPK